MAHCGAKTRSGEPCKRHAVPGSSKCKLHGGAASKANKGNKHAAKPGSIYSQFLTDAENDMLASIELGRVDDELRLTRIRLMRALARENEHGNTLEADSEKREPVEIDGKPVMVDGKPVEKVTITTKVRDYIGMIDRLTGRIESLERTRAELLKTNPPELPPVTRIEIEVVGGRKDAAGANDAAAG